MAEEKATYTHTNMYGTDTFRVVNSIDEVPLGYEIWNIGRHNFPLRGYLPMARVTDFQVDIKTLIAAPVESEERALYLMNLAHKKHFTSMDIARGNV